MPDSPLGNNPYIKHLIQHCPDADLHAGKIAGDRQVLMGLLYPNITAVVFDDEGEFLKVNYTSAPAAEMHPDGDVYLLHSPEYQERYLELLERCKGEIEFQAGTIWIRPFWIDEDYIGIRPLPSHLEEFLVNPDDVAEDEEEKEDLLEDIKDWRASGNFVLWWGKDFWMDASGEIEST